jgi:hypothetical protein
VTDEEWIAERKRRINEILAELEADNARYRDDPDSTSDPGVVRPRRGRWYDSVLAVLILLAVWWLLTSLAITLARFGGNNLDDARRRGTATVETCERHGPITLTHGFGFYDTCTVKIVWDSGYPSRVVIDKPGFFNGEQAGDTFEIGENTGSRGSIGYSRAELPDRLWLAAITVVIGIIGAIPLLVVAAYLWRSFKGLFRRS